MATAISGPVEPMGFIMDPNHPSGPGVDFSELPDVVWIKILSFLSYSSRCQVAQTCHHLLETFDHPSLWERLEIVLSTLWDENYPAGYKYVDPERQTNHIQRFGKYVKTLVLVFVSHKITIDSNIKEVMQCLGTSCRPEHVVIDVTMVKTKRDLFWDSNKLADFSPIHTLVEASDRLVSVTLRSWPLSRGGTIPCLSACGRASKLKKLHLFWESASQATWASMILNLPDPQSIVHMLSPFVSLQSLALRSSMLSEDLLEMLSTGKHRARLRHLYILLTYSAVNSEEHVPTMNSSVWEKVVAFSPELRVEVTVMTRMPTPLLVYVLDKNAPIGGIEIMKYAKITPEILRILIQRYSRTLSKFVCYATPDEDDKLDRHLLDMVTKCKELKHFVYFGRIHCDTMVALSAIHGESWQKFSVMEDEIISGVQADEDDEEQWDEDEIVIHQYPDGSCELAHPRQQTDEEEHWRRVTEAVQLVSKNLGYNWLPVHSRTLEVTLNGTTVGLRGWRTEQLTATPSKFPIAKGWPWHGE